jgi:TorA maturation chaperone TorD
MVRADDERPDGAPDPDEIDAARAQEYALLATLLSRAPDKTLLSRIARLPGDTSPLGAAHAAVAEAARNADAANVEREYFALFVGLGRAELLPYGSYYLSGFLHDRPLARLRVMAGLVGGRFPAAPGSDRLLFEKHLAPWIGRFFADVERAKSAEFYRAVGALGRVFIDIETEAFAMPG